MNLERERGVFMLTNETIALMEELTQAVGKEYLKNYENAYGALC